MLQCQLPCAAAAAGQLPAAHQAGAAAACGGGEHGAADATLQFEHGGGAAAAGAGTAALTTLAVASCVRYSAGERLLVADFFVRSWTADWFAVGGVSKDATVGAALRLSVQLAAATCWQCSVAAELMAQLVLGGKGSSLCRV